MDILVLNAGSSSLKFQVVNTDTEESLIEGQAEGIGLTTAQFSFKENGQKTKENKSIETHNQAVELVVELIKEKIGLENISAIGHRVVHGGEFYSDSALVDENVIENIKKLFSLAPLHNPPNLAGILACQKIMPNLPQVAVFDTAFHQTISKENFLYPIPYEHYENYRVRKYGFHGTSHRYVMGKAMELVGSDSKIITCHLGNGSSLCAIENGKSVNTTMGFTPLQGVIMGTRSGDIDASIVEFLEDKENMAVSEIIKMLNKESGLKGICGDSDMRTIHEEREKGSEKHELAFQMLVHRLKLFVGSYFAELNGCDALIFTGGIGEKDEFVREGVCKGLENLGIRIDYPKNLDTFAKFAELSLPDSKVKVYVIPTNEELMIAKDTAKIISSL
jgi:acetate kinase